MEKKDDEKALVFSIPEGKLVLAAYRDPEEKGGVIAMFSYSEVAYKPGTELPPGQLTTPLLEYE